MRSAFLLVLILSAGCTPPPPPAEQSLQPTLLRQDVGVSVLFIGAHAVDSRTAWLAGTGGTFARTTDGGETWTSGVVPGADSLQFRDVHAIDARTAFLLSIGPGAQSRIFRTRDSGATWSERFVNADEEAFFDCFAFWDDLSGLAFSDSFDGAFPIIVTRNGGERWEPLPTERLPAAQPNEGGFAASGTCVVTIGDSTALIGTGNAASSRLLRTDDRGRSWTAYETPVAGGEAAGIASVAFRTPEHGVVLGGDIARPAVYTDNVARTEDGGETWQSGGRLPFPGAVYGAAYVPERGILVAVGPGGAAFSHDDGRSWASLDTLAHWGVSFAAPSAGWLVGPAGRITKVAFR